MKGLNVGDTFKEGLLTYKVIEVLPDGNYISKCVGVSDEEDAPIVDEEVEKPKRGRRKTVTE